MPILNKVMLFALSAACAVFRQLSQGEFHGFVIMEGEQSVCPLQINSTASALSQASKL